MRGDVGWDMSVSPLLCCPMVFAIADEATVVKVTNERIVMIITEDVDILMTYEVMISGIWGRLAGATCIIRKYARQFMPQQWREVPVGLGRYRLDAEVGKGWDGSTRWSVVAYRKLGVAL